MEAHAKWKYQINTDGQSASWRLAKLLAIDSPILKYRSDNIEYYYRCGRWRGRRGDGMQRGRLWRDSWAGMGCGRGGAYRCRHKVHYGLRGQKWGVCNAMSP